MQKGKMVVWGGLTNSWEKKRSEMQRRKRYAFRHLNAEFQRIVRRAKKAFLSDWCKELKENNRMGKTRDLFKKTRDTKGIFHAKMGTIKDRNDMDLTEAEDIKKRWQGYIETDTKNIFITQIIRMAWPRPIHPGVGRQVSLGNITMSKASGGDGIPAELFQILRDNAVKVPHSIC